MSHKNPFVWCLDIIIPTQFEASRIIFNCRTDIGDAQIKGGDLIKRYRGFYHIEEDNRNAVKTRGGGGFFGGTSWNIKNEAYKASILILQQLVDQIKSWKTYNHSLQILGTIRNIWATEEAWNMAKGILISHYEIINVWKLQLIWRVVTNDNLSLNITEMYHILEIYHQILSYFREQTRIEIGIAIYDSFVDIVQHFCLLKSKYLNPANYLKLYSLVNLFRYFENMKAKHGRSGIKQLEFQNYKQKQDYFVRNEKWMDLDLQKMLMIDLDIGSFKEYHRMYPFENRLFKLAAILKNRGKHQSALNLYRNTFQTLISNPQSGRLITDIFKYQYVVNSIFSILGNDFNSLWKELINILDPRRISTNKQILGAFHEKLKQQIAAMDNKNNKLKELYQAIVTFESKYSNSQPLPKSKLQKTVKQQNCKLCNKILKSKMMNSDVRHCKFWYVAI